MLLDEPTDPVTPHEKDWRHTERSSRADSRTLLVTGVLTGTLFLASAALLYVLHPVVAIPLAAATGAGLALVRSKNLTAPAVGALSWYAICAAGTVAVLMTARTEQHTLIAGLAMTTAAIAAGTLIWARQQVRTGRSPRVLMSQALAIFSHPTSGLAATVLGAGLALPLVGTYAPVTSDPDSAWLTASTQHVQRHGVELLQQTHDVFVPHLTIGPLLALDGYRLAIPFMILTSVGLSALAAYLGYRITQHGVGALAAAAALMAFPVVPERADRLPMYALTFIFAYGAAWVLHRAMSSEHSPRWWAVIAGAGFVLSYEAHGVGQVFLLTPFLLVLLHPWRRALKPLVTALAAIGVLSIPRIITNLSIDGFQSFRTNYADYMIQDHLPLVNRDFWQHNNDTSTLGYMTNLPKMAQEALGSWGMLLLLLIPVVLAAVTASRRARIFVAASTLIFLAALAISTPATFGRYLSPLAVGFALIVGVGVTHAIRSRGESRILGVAMISILVAAAFIQMVDTVSVKVHERNTIVNGPWSELAAAVDDDRAVIGSRSHQLLWADPGVRTIFGRTMAEEDWITYLSWPNDEDVIEMMNENEIGWVYLMPNQRFEVEYHNTWMEPTYDLSVNHPWGVYESDQFCLVAESAGRMLYRLGDCQPGDIRERPVEDDDEDLEEDVHDTSHPLDSQPEDGTESGEDSGENSDEPDGPFSGTDDGGMEGRPGENV